MPPAIYVPMHSAAAHEPAVLLTHSVWAAVCAHCELRCVHGRGGRRPPTEWDVLIEGETTHSPQEIAGALVAASSSLAPRRLLLVHAPAAQFPAALTYSARGAILASVAHGERLRAHLSSALEALGAEHSLYERPRPKPQPRNGKVDSNANDHNPNPVTRAQASSPYSTARAAPQLRSCGVVSSVLAPTADSISTIAPTATTPAANPTINPTIAAATF